MLKFFKTNQVFLSAILIFYIILLRFSVLLAPFKWNPSGQGILSEWVYGWAGSQQLISHILATLVLLVQGFIINVLVINHRLSNEVNLYPGLFFVLLSCFIPDFLYLSPVLLGNLFFLFALVELFDTYKNPACADRIFNAGLWTGIASLFYMPFLFFFIVIMSGLNILRAFSLRERLMALIGLLLPYSFAGLYFFWFNRLDEFWQKQFVANFDFLSFGGAPFGWETLIKVGFFAVLIFLAVFNNNLYLIKKNIQVQKKINILYWIILSALLAAPFQQNLTLEHFLMITPPLGIFLAFTFSTMKPQWAEAIHFLMVVAALTLQFTWWF